MQRNETIGLRERKLRATRTALETATVDLAIEHGLANVTVEQIAARADVSPRTFFNHFPSKEAALLGANAGRTVEETLATFPAPSQGRSAYDDLKAFAVAQVEELVFGDPLLARRMEALALHPELARRHMSEVAGMVEALALVVARRLTGPRGRAEAAPPEGTLAEARMLVHVCSAALRFSLEPGGARHPRATDAFDLLERVVTEHVCRAGGPTATAEGDPDAA